VAADARQSAQIKRLRDEFGLTQRELGALLGVSNVTVSRWEQGLVAPRPAMRRRWEALARELAETRATTPTVDHGHPPAASSFIGRARELALLPPLLRNERLLTLRGPGGAGKTRLALEATRHLPGKTFFVDLAPLPAGSEIAPAVAAALELRPAGTAPLAERLAAVIGERPLLLLLDNAEHVLPGCRALCSTLLAACPGLHLLVTSREELGLPGETVWPVAPLPLPASDDLAEVTRSEAAALFVARAREADPGFRFDAAAAPAIARLCRRLDGLPLALELAAARAPLLPVEQIATRLDDRFRLLRRAQTDLPARQQALEAAIAWSHDLLDPAEQAIFRRLGVFSGSFDLDGAEAVADDPAALDGVVALARRSLVETLPKGEHGLRWRLLESIRAFAADALARSGEEAAVRRRHALWCAELAERAAARWHGPEQPAALRELEREADNIRGALAWAVANDADVAARLGAALWRWWQANGRYAEGETALERVASVAAPATRTGAETRFGLARLRLRRGKRTEARAAAEASREAFAAAGSAVGEARATDLLGLLAARRGELAAAKALHDEALAMARAIGARRVEAEALLHLGALANTEGDRALAEQRDAEAWALIQGDGDLEAEAVVLNNLGDLAARRGDGRRAVSFYERSLARSRQLEHAEGIAAKLVNLAEARLLLGEIGPARALAAEGVARYRALADRERLADALYVEGLVHTEAGEPEAAASLGEALALYQALGDRANQGHTLELLAAVALRHGEAATAASWLGAGEALRAAAGEPPYLPARLAATLDGARTSLGPLLLAEAMAAGRNAPEAVVLVEACHYLPPTSPPPPAGLTPRQRDVLRLVAEGRSNREIGQTLGISARTVERHLSAIYAATGANRRAGAVRALLGESN
jgi:predicted ATPase/DNA-binding CsgD family transcriptional regulator/DNA-binding XRE family transcriptional regulator